MKHLMPVKDQLKFGAFIILLVALIVVGHFLDLDERITLDGVRDMILRTGRWQFPVFAALYCVSAVIPAPTVLLSTASGAMWGPYLGTVVTVISATTAACIPFFLSRLMGRGIISKMLNKHPTADKCDRFAGRNGFAAVLTMRLIPIFPWDAVNYLSGLCGIRFRDYLIASLIGTIPASFTYNLIGASLGQPLNKTPIYIVIGIVAVVVITMIFIRRKTSVSQKGHQMDTPDIPAQNTGIDDADSGIEPRDAHNQRLLANAHPADWRNPTPSGRYNMVVIGGGTAGLVTAAGVAGLGGTVALVERQLLGGDCLNFGCVPSKTLIAAARMTADIAGAERYGVRPGSGSVDFAAVMERVRRIRSKISEHDSAKRFRELGVDVFIGDAAFTGPDTVEVDGQKLRFAKSCIATGARALRPAIEGLEEAGFHTNETIFSLTELPRRLAVLGSGPIGCELGQAFARLGSEVTIVEKGSQFLGREDRDAAEVVGAAFMADGIHCLLNAMVRRVTRDNTGRHVHIETPGGEKIVDADEILVGFGRVPNIDGLGLEAAGIEYDARHGVKVDDRLRTTNKRVYAAGDVCLRHKFTHTADAAARIVIQNALFFGRKRVSALTIPWCIYTHPEIAHVGMYEADARQQGIKTDTFKIDMAEIDRAQTDGETEGFVKVLVRKGTDTILGATIVSAHAGEMISEISAAMAAKAGLKTLAGVIHPYPTQAEAIKRAADAYSRTRLTPAVKSLFGKWLAWQRR